MRLAHRAEQVFSFVFGHGRRIVDDAARSRSQSTARGRIARTLIRASVPERGAMRLSTIFDRDPIIHEQELLKAEDELVASLARYASPL